MRFFSAGLVFSSDLSPQDPEYALGPGYAQGLVYFLDPGYVLDYLRVESHPAAKCPTSLGDLCVCVESVLYRL